MNRTFIFLALASFFATSLLADTPASRLHINAYYIGQEDITNTVDFAIEKWTYRSITTPYLTKNTIYGIEIELYKTGVESPVNKIILENGNAGGTRIAFEKASFISRDISSQSLVGYYTEYSDDETSGHIINIYESENIGPSTELLTLFLVNE
jgi:hypothetical protein